MTPSREDPIRVDFRFQASSWLGRSRTLRGGMLGHDVAKLDVPPPNPGALSPPHRALRAGIDLPWMKSTRRGHVPIALGHPAVERGAMFELKLLGGATVHDKAGTLSGPASHRHSLALLSLLSCAPDLTLSRGKLTGFLWPGSAERVARNRLNTGVHRLRKALGGDVLLSVGGGLRLNARRIRSDVGQFRVALEAGESEAAVALYAGPFLDGFWLRDSPEFEQWAERERDRLRRGYREALEALAMGAEERKEAMLAVRWWRERAREDPHDARVTIRLMNALAAAGNRAEALRVGQEHLEAFEAEFEAEPSARVRALTREFQGEASGPGGDRLSIAVLPFESLGVDQPSTLAEGLHHDLLTRLSSVTALSVTSRTSVLRYRGTSVPLPEIAGALGVGTIVEGAVQQVGDRVRLNIQVIDARSDGHRWADTFDRELTTENLFEIQSELAETIAQRLRAELTPHERARMTRGAPTGSLEAYRHQQEGRLRLDKRTDDGMRRAVRHFRRAIAEDPDYALAWVGLADALTLRYEYGYAGADETFPEATSAVERALALDPELAAAHASRALMHEARHEGPPAIHGYARAVELEPSHADAHNWMSWTYQLLGRGEAALECSLRAVQLNPLAPEVVGNLAATRLVTGDPETALREARRAHRLQPDETSAAFYEAHAQLALGEPDEARKLLEGLLVPWAGSGPLLALAMIHATSDSKPEARSLFGRLAEAGDTFGVGMVHATLGERERAFAALERVERWAYWPTLAMHFHYRDMLGDFCEDARFRAVLERVRRHWGLNPDGSFPA
ncbi:MAG: hypothetical protein EA351_09965 [Gemmatimonadales bacterium]|nr:MAG: hypothetical protein EA351_09965 [Gemmatimonadales bacterium]